MKKCSALLALVLVLTACAPRTMLSEVSRSDGSTVHRLTCRAKIDCPQQAAQLCPGGYELVDETVGIIGTLSDLTISCR